jgi:hypothetical protein
MARPRESGGIGKKGGSNVNPVYGLVNRFEKYFDNMSKEFTEQNSVKNKYGVDSKEYKEANRQVKGAVLQGRRYNKSGKQVK